MYRTCTGGVQDSEAIEGMYRRFTGGCIGHAQEESRIVRTIEGMYRSSAGVV